MGALASPDAVLVSVMICCVADGAVAQVVVPFGLAKAGLLWKLLYEYPYWASKRRVKSLRYPIISIPESMLQ